MPNSLMVGNEEVLKDRWGRELEKALAGQIWASLSIKVNNANNGL